MTTIVAYVPDLLDRSRLSAVRTGIEFVGSPAALLARVGGPAADGATVAVAVVDLARPGVDAVLGHLVAAVPRVIGFGAHVDAEVLGRARAAGCREVLARSAFFRQAAELLAE